MTSSKRYCCHNRFFFDNVFEEISDPGEYYVNVTAQIVYLIPPVDSATTAPTTATAAAATSTAKVEALPPMMASTMATPAFAFDATATGISIDNIRVTVSRGSGFSALESQNISIANVEVSNVGLFGATLGANSSIVDSHIHHVGTTGVETSAGSTRTLVPGNTLIRNCHIHHFAYWMQVYTPGVYLGGVSNKVEHCNIHDGPHCGMLLYGNDNVVVNNEFSFVGLKYVMLSFWGMWFWCCFSSFGNSKY